MSTYAIDSERQEMVATGIVAPLMEWIETADGRRRPSDIQDRDEKTGMPLWQVEVSYRSASFGREYTVTAMVAVGAMDIPNPAPFTHIVFDVLRVEAHVNKAGGFSERWSAESVKKLTPETPKTRVPDKPGEKAVA